MHSSISRAHLALRDPEMPCVMLQPLPGSDSKLLQSSDGCAIYAEATGNPDRPHVVLIHGMTYCGVIFDDLCRVPEMLDKLYVVRYDLRGHGRSGKPETSEGHTSKLYADDFMLVVEAFKLKMPVLAGWSFGGSTAIDLAANVTPIPISGVFYINSTAVLKGNGTPTMAAIMSLGTNIATSSLALHRQREACFDAPGVRQPSFYENCFFSGIQSMQPYNVRRASMNREWPNTEPYLKALKEGKVKVFVYYGLHDVLLNGAVLEAEMKEWAKDVEVKSLEKGGHAMFWQFPEETATSLVGFAERVWYGGTGGNI